jgi:hypothetical protein
VLFFVLLSVAGFAQTTNVWTPHGPEGGNVVRPVIDSQSPGMLYVSGGGRLFEETWKPRETGTDDTVPRIAHRRFGTGSSVLPPCLTKNVGVICALPIETPTSLLRTSRKRDWSSVASGVQ